MSEAHGNPANTPPMPSLAQMLGRAVGPVEFEALGRRWKISPPTLGTKAAYERELKQAVLQQIKTLREIDPEIYETALQDFLKNLHEYHVGGQRFMELSGKAEFQILFWKVLLREHQPDVETSTVWQLVATPEFQAILPEILVFFLQIFLLVYPASMVESLLRQAGLLPAHSGPKETQLEKESSKPAMAT